MVTDFDTCLDRHVLGIIERERVFKHQMAHVEWVKWNIGKLIKRLENSLKN